MLDPLEWARRITNQIPDPQLQVTRFYDAYPKRARRLNGLRYRTITLGTWVQF